MQFDIRIPIGALFTCLGIILTAYGMVTDSAAYARSLGHNVNLSWGLVILVVGLVFLGFAHRSAARMRAAA